ncbi:MAG: DUF4911 domain-containing protein [Bdellovibrionota bacterium]
MNKDTKKIDINKINIDALDDKTSGIYLKVPEKKVVMMQSYFEIYDGIATVRTLDIRNSLICIIVPNCNLQICLEILESIKKDVGFEFIKKPENIKENDFVGFKNTQVFRGGRV